MIDFSQALQDKIDRITENWIEAVRGDEKIGTAKQLTYDSVRDSLPIVLQAIVTLLSQSEESDFRAVIQESLRARECQGKTRLRCPRNCAGIPLAAEGNFRCFRARIAKRLQPLK